MYIYIHIYDVFRFLSWRKLSETNQKSKITNVARLRTATDSSLIVRSRATLVRSRATLVRSRATLVRSRATLVPSRATLVRSRATLSQATLVRSRATFVIVARLRTISDTN